MTAITIRDYKTEDAQALADIYYNTIHQINIRDYSESQVDAWAPPTSLNVEAWKKKWEKLKPFIAVVDNMVVGFVEFEPNGHIDCFYCHHDWIGKGVGSALMKAVISSAKKQNITRIFVEVSITAKPFFEGKGFRVVKQQTIVRRGIELTNFVMEMIKENSIEIVKATVGQLPILANLLELMAYEHSEQWKFDIGDNGFYGYEDLPLFWTDPNRHPYLIYVNDKIAGLVMVQKGSPISDDKEIWDMAELFIMKKYKKQGIGTAVTQKIWSQFKGRWQIRVLVENEIASAFWLQAIKKFSSKPPAHTIKHIQAEGWSADWNIYQFESPGEPKKAL